MQRALKEGMKSINPTPVILLVNPAVFEMRSTEASETKD